MAIYLRNGMRGIGAYNVGLKNRVVAAPQIVPLRNHFVGKQIMLNAPKSGLNGFNPKSHSSFFTHAQKSYNIREEKLNKVEIKSAQDFVDTLRNAGDKLVVVDFHSSACKPRNTLYPMIDKFKHALAKHSADSTNLGSAKGSNDSELQELASHKLIEFSYPQESSE